MLLSLGLQFITAKKIVLVISPGVLKENKLWSDSQILLSSVAGRIVPPYILTRGAGGHGTGALLMLSGATVFST